jgi:hypothetical protein
MPLAQPTGPVALGWDRVQMAGEQDEWTLAAVVNAREHTRVAGVVDGHTAGPQNRQDMLDYVSL